MNKLQMAYILMHEEPKNPMKFLKELDPKSNYFKRKKAIRIYKN